MSIEKYPQGEKMLKIDQFRARMEGPKKIYSEELKRFAKRYDFLSEFTLVEEPDIDTLDYVYYFNNLNGTSKETLKSRLSEIYDHMDKFSQSKGIYEYNENVVIILKR